MGRNYEAKERVEIMSNYKSQYNPHNLNNNWNLALDNIKEGSTVLDVGCSNGNFGQALIELKRCVVDGVEPDRGDAHEASEKLRKVYNTTIELAIDNIKKSKITYDHIVFMDVVEHLVDPVSILASLHKLLNKNGSIVFSIPNMAHQSVRLMLLSGDFEYGKTGILDNTHLHFYTATEINRVFNEAGYQIDKLTGVSVLYDDDTLRSELDSIGIKTPSTELVKVLSDNNAHIYQFIAAAHPSGAPKLKTLERKFQSPEAKRIMQDTYNQNLRNITEDLNKKIKEQELTIERYQKKISKITNSIPWKVVVVVRGVFGYLSTSIKSMGRKTET